MAKLPPVAVAPYSANPEAPAAPPKPVPLILIPVSLTIAWPVAKLPPLPDAPYCEYWVVELVVPYCVNPAAPAAPAPAPTPNPAPAPTPAPVPYCENSVVLVAPYCENPAPAPAPAPVPNPNPAPAPAPAPNPNPAPAPAPAPNPNPAPAPAPAPNCENSVVLVAPYCDSTAAFTFVPPKTTPLFTGGSLTAGLVIVPPIIGGKTLVSPLIAGLTDVLTCVCSVFVTVSPWLTVLPTVTPPWISFLTPPIVTSCCLTVSFSLISFPTVVDPVTWLTVEVLTIAFLYSVPP